MNEWYNAYEVLSKVLINGAYVNLALGKQTYQNQPRVSKVVYGVLENYYRLNAIMDSIVERSPKKKVKVLLLMGIYSLIFLDIPNYAIINEIVNITKKTREKQQANFVNAVLHKVSRGEYKIDENDPEILYNVPRWLFDEIKSQYFKEYKLILNRIEDGLTHFRVNNLINDLSVFSKEEVLELNTTLKEILETNKIKETDYGYIGNFDDKVQMLFKKGLVTVQAEGSILIAMLFGDVKGQEVLDCCAAPGGKAVFLAENGASVTALDIYPHRTNLIKEYAKRMRVNLKVEQEDASKLNLNRLGKYKNVLVDVPCSGIGAIGKRQDLVIRLEKQNIDDLVLQQYNILENCAKYVASDGRLLYSTCTILRQENEEIIYRFLENNKSFILERTGHEKENKDGFIKLLPNIDYTEGFFLAIMRRIES